MRQNPLKKVQSGILLKRPSKVENLKALPAGKSSHLSHSRRRQVSFLSTQILKCHTLCGIKKPCGYLPILDKKTGIVRCVEQAEIFIEGRENE